MSETPASDANAIEVRVETIDQMFASLDPSPFREKDLDKDAEEFIVNWAQEIPSDQPIKIVVHLPAEELARPEAKEIGPAITRFFDYRAQLLDFEVKELFRIGRRSLVIGVTVLAVSIVAGQTVSARLEPRPLAEVIEQSLLIFAWVANWRPIEIFLYDWWPIGRRRDQYRRLASAAIELKPFKPGDERQSFFAR